VEDYQVKEDTEWIGRCPNCGVTVITTAVWDEKIVDLEEIAHERKIIREFRIWQEAKAKCPHCKAVLTVHRVSVLRLLWL